MALASLAAIVFFVLGLAFFSPALSAANTVSGSQVLAAQGTSLQVVTLGAIGIALLSLGTAFACFAAIKIQVSRNEKYLKVCRRVRTVGFGFLWLSVAVGFSLALVHALVAVAQ